MVYTFTYTTIKKDWIATDSLTNTDLDRIEENIGADHAAVEDHIVVDTGLGEHLTVSSHRTDYTLPLIIETLASDPASPADGRLWISGA